MKAARVDRSKRIEPYVFRLDVAMPGNCQACAQSLANQADLSWLLRNNLSVDSALKPLLDCLWLNRHSATKDLSRTEHRIGRCGTKCCRETANRRHDLRHSNLLQLGYD